MRPHRRSTVAARVFVVACLILEWERSAFAQTPGHGTGTGAAGSRPDLFPLLAPPPGALFDLGKPGFTVRTDAESWERPTVPSRLSGTFRAAVGGAVADAIARPALSVSSAQAAPAKSRSKNRALMWILIAAGAGGAVVTVALLKRNGGDDAPTITVGTPTIGAP